MSEQNLQLTGKQKRFLRSKANKMDDSIVVGRSGLSEKSFESVKEALKKYELVKVRVKPSCGVERKEAAALLAEETNSICVQVFGGTVLLYRAGDGENKIKLP